MKQDLNKFCVCLSFIATQVTAGVVFALSIALLVSSFFLTKGINSVSIRQIHKSNEKLDLC